ncbi:MAG: hypothetical protein HDR01_12235 [Lachnospiraceae bacterium]|nr:hypothetical protein [Lachnospiraceae bacterium]
MPHMEEAFGYSFERFVLYAQSIGIGTVCIGETAKRMQEIVGASAVVKEGTRLCGTVSEAVRVAYEGGRQV